MKKDFGENTNNNFHNSLEGYTIYDKLSARTLNRPILNLYSDNEDKDILIKAILQKLFKEEGSIPEAYENFDPLKLKIVKIKGRLYLRIPTGIAIINNGKDVIVNKPEISMQERKFGKLLGMDLSDQFNDIVINKNKEGYFMIMSFNEKNGGTRDIRVPAEGNCESWELFPEFVKYYDSYIIVSEVNYKYYNVLERCIDVTDIDKNKKYYLYYATDSIPVTGIADISNDYFISTEDSEIGIKLLSFNLNDVNESIVVDNSTKEIKDIVY